LITSFAACATLAAYSPISASIRRLGMALKILAESSVRYRTSIAPTFLLSDQFPPVNHDVKELYFIRNFIGKSVPGFSPLGYGNAGRMAAARGQ
jgi:hypothetical protein